MTASTGPTKPRRRGIPWRGVLVAVMLAWAVASGWLVIEQASLRATVSDLRTRQYFDRSALQRLRALNESQELRLRRLEGRQP